MSPAPVATVLFPLVLLVACTVSSGGATLPGCQAPDPTLASLDKGRPTRIGFKNEAGHGVKVAWLNFHGEETAPNFIADGGLLRQSSFTGHAFRVRHARNGKSMMEYRATGTDQQEVTIRACTATGAPTCDSSASCDGEEPFRVTNETTSLAMSLRHDQHAPCIGWGKSGQWSCTRVVPEIQLAERAAEEYGFQPEDLLNQDPECARMNRSLRTWTDDDYSHASNRLAVPRASTGPGFLKMSLPPVVARVLREWAAEHAGHWEHPDQTPASREYLEAEAIGGCYSNTHAFPFSLLNMDHFPEIRTMLIEELQPILEWWASGRLEHTSTYGLRIYKRDAMLINHVDRRDTHIVSAVIQVLQKVDEDGGWPLEVVGDDGTVHEVYLQPGEMVLYEGARHLHGRPMRLKGDYFGNIFTHYKLARN